MSSHKDPNNRRASFKLPPLARPGDVQEARRLAALEQQQKRREKLIAQARQQTYFAALAPLTPDSDGSPPSPSSPVQFFPSTDPPFSPPGGSSSSGVFFPDSSALATSPTHTHSPFGPKRQPKPRKSELRWANRLMYAEILELGGSGAPRMEVDREVVLEGSNGMGGVQAEVVMGEDGLPEDLETGWVALAPVPVGKRCMAVTYALDNGAVVTALHSRLSGHLFLRYPSPLPPDTILDCILDSKWQDTGLLHVLDVMRWRSQDLSTCEAEFRFWFLAQRCAELPLMPPPTQPPFKQPYILQPVPFFPPPLTPAVLLMNVLPPAKVGRMIPLLAPLPSPGAVRDTMPVDEYGRALPGSSSSTTTTSPTTTTPFGTFPTQGQLQGPRETHCASDGLLLYLKAATYQSGPTPLACWVPNAPLEGEAESRLDVFERCVRIRHARELVDASDRLLRARAAQAGVANGYEVTMEEG